MIVTKYLVWRRRGAPRPSPRVRTVVLHLTNCAPRANQGRSFSICQGWVKPSNLVPTVLGLFPVGLFPSIFPSQVFFPPVFSPLGLFPARSFQGRRLGGQGWATAHPWLSSCPPLAFPYCSPLLSWMLSFCEIFSLISQNFDDVCVLYICIYIKINIYAATYLHVQDHQIIKHTESV